MQAKKFSVSLKRIYYLIYTAALILLFKSVLAAGLNYQYDIDELFHVQHIFLYSRSLLPFKDVFSIYSPLFHYLLMPVMRIAGFTFSGIYLLRIIMAIGFLVPMLF